MVTAGNANAFTGRSGDEVVCSAATALAQIVGCSAHQVMIAQTGVIGEPFPIDRLTNQLPDAIQALTKPDWQAAAQAITTTDTFPKGASRTAILLGKEVTINGIAKGSGMIAPDMATMLAFLFTDATLPSATLDHLLRGATAQSFNAITVDSDTSTSDTVMLFATAKGAGSTDLTDPDAPALADFRRALLEVCQDLAWQIVADGEGATKFITVRVSGAQSDAAARTIAFAIANSPLVKTAIAGGDANWGRVVMAVGKSGEAADRDRLSIHFGTHRVASDGARDDNYDEVVLADYMKQDRIEIGVDVGVGEGQSTVWTCDLTHGYISINGDYRS